MRVKIQKTGLWLAAVAVLFIAAVLPFHHHAHDAGKAPATHQCAVCSFSGQSRLITPTLAQAEVMPLAYSALLPETVFTSVACDFFDNHSPRGPPLS